MAVDLNRAWKTYNSLQAAGVSASAAAQPKEISPKLAAAKRINEAYTAALTSDEALHTLQEMYRIERGSPPSRPPVAPESFDEDAPEPEGRPESAKVAQFAKKYAALMNQNPNDPAAVKKIADFYGSSAQRFERLQGLVSQLEAG